MVNLPLLLVSSAQNSRQAAVQVEARRYIIGTTKSFVNFQNSAKAITTGTIIRSENNIRAIIAGAPMCALVLAAMIAIKAMTPMSRAKKTKDMIPTTIRKRKRLLPWRRYLRQGTLISALFRATQCRNINLPRLLSQVIRTLIAIINTATAMTVGMSQAKLSAMKFFAWSRAWSG